MMRNAIFNFHIQFSFDPVIQNRQYFKPKNKFIIAGMGGSQLAAELLETLELGIDFIIHKDYGLPALSIPELKDYLIITSSYSGNTEETLDSFVQAQQKKLPLIVITTGGKLLQLAQKYRIPYIQLPNTGIQPRSALGFSFKAMLKAMGQEKLLRTASALAKTLTLSQYERKGKLLAKKLKGYVPIVYSSAKNYGLAYNWKIKLNETGKIPAFCNVLPELNHNEMNAFDVKKSTQKLCGNFYFIFLKDSKDNPHILKRMKVLKTLYGNRNLKVQEVLVGGENPLHKLFSSVALADWTAYYTAKLYGLDPNEVPMVEEFKKLI